MRCPDCKDGFYYPLVGEREPCQTCRRAVPGFHYTNIRLDERMSGYAFYSQLMVDAGIGAIRYDLVEGGTIVGTACSKTPDSGCKWPDIKFIGRIWMHK